MAGVKKLGKKRQALADKKKPQKKRVLASAHLDEEISSDSEVEEDFLDDDPKKRRTAVEEEDEDDLDTETPQERRVRLAREYLEKIKAEEEDNLDSEHTKNAAVVHRLREEQLDFAGKLKKPLADKIDLEGLVEKTVLKCRDQRSPITCAVLSADGKFVFSGAKDGSIVKYDLTEKKRVGMIKRTTAEPDEDNPKAHSKAILSLAVSDDSKYLASSCAQGLILIWNPVDLSLLGKFKGHRAAVTGVAIQKGANPHLYSSSADKTVKVWSLPEMAYIETLFGHQETIPAIDCLRRERAITCGARDSSVRIWKIPEESQLVFNAPDGNSVDCVKLIDEQHFISGDDQGMLAFWHALKKKPVCKLDKAHGVDAGSGNPRWITAIAALHNSDVVVSGSWDNVLRVWKFDEDKRQVSELLGIPIEGVINSLQFSSDGRKIIAAVSKEPRLGRWCSVKSANNSVVVINLPLIGGG